MTHVTIVMATYNGADFLTEQLASIRNQTHQDWTLIVRDDGSTDGTVALLDEASRQDSRITVWDGPDANLGSAANFGVLMQHAGDASYVMCADQDDVWDPDKVAVSLSRLRRLEGPQGDPCLLFTDFRIVGPDGAPLAPQSPVASQVRALSSLDLRSLLGYDYVWGCTTIANQALLRLALPIPPQAQNHDYWLALVAAANGSLHYLDRPTLSYRKHDTNVTGGSDVGSWRQRLRRQLPPGRPAGRAAVRRHDDQMRFLHEFLVQGGIGADADVSLLAEYVAALEARSVSRLRRMRRLGVRRQGWLQELAHAGAVLTLRRR